MDKYVYMIGIDPDYWTTDDDKACKQYKVDCKGYYELGTDEGFILVGTLKNLKKLLEDYFGVAIVDEYLTEYDYFYFEDGEWISGGWNESKKSVGKSLKESSSAYKEFLKNYKIKGTLHGDVDDLRVGKNDYYFADIIFDKDGIYVKDLIDGSELFIDGDDIVDYIDVGMGASDFAFNVGDGKTITRYSIHITIARKFRNNIVRNF